MAGMGIEKKGKRKEKRKREKKSSLSAAFGYGSHNLSHGKWCAIRTF